MKKDGVPTLLDRFLLNGINRTRVRFLCWGVLAISLVFLGVSFATVDQGRTLFGTTLGADFAGFYTAGTILNQNDPVDRDHLYDSHFHDTLYHGLFPHIEEEERLPFVYPPFVALPLSLLARLPYETAFGVWLCLSMGFYLTGCTLLWKTRQALPAEDMSTALLLAMAFEPFVMESWLGGQISAVGFFALALLIFCDQACRPFAAGLALGIFLYKPTLLILLLPLLVVARNWRALAGFCLTGLTLAGISFAGAGRKNCLDYTERILGFARTTAGGSGNGEQIELRLWKYVDLNAFFRQLLGSHSTLNWVLIALVAGGPLGFLVIFWWQLPLKKESSRRLIWASTLTWSMVFNLYVGVYDTILALPAAFITVDVLRRKGSVANTGGTSTLLLALLFLVPWVSQPLARATGLQIYTLILMAVGAYQLYLARNFGLVKEET